MPGVLFWWCYGPLGQDGSRQTALAGLPSRFLDLGSGKGLRLERVVPGLRPQRSWAASRSVRVYALEP